MDISETLAPASEQLDAIELVGGARTFVIESVSRGSADQPVNVHLVGFPRPWRPGKSMRRVLAFCWGNDASVWVGRSVRLFCDPEVTFGKDKVMGTRIESLSDIDEPKKVPLLISRGKSSIYVVQPLTEPATPTAEDWAAKIADSDSIVELRGWWQIATAANRKLIEARVKAIEAAALEGGA